MAVTLREHVPERVVFHADRPTQYTSDQLWEVCTQTGLVPSAGRIGVCFDHAMAESFWSTPKNEYYHRHTWQTGAQAKTAVARWIEAVYNRQRRHSKIGYIPPVQFKQQYQSTTTEKQAA